jgi:glycerol kinase
MLKTWRLFMGKYILALDQGTTSSRAILFDRDQNIIGSEQREVLQIYPKEGWVEHDPMEIYSSQCEVMLRLISKLGIDPREISALGIGNQRETTAVWDKTTGRPIYNAIVWQCRRTSDIVDALVKDGLGEYIKKTTGLVPDAYFSGTKIKWILDHVEGSRERAKKGEILFGTVDTWLIWKLTNGAVHATDYTNASRTMIYDIRKLDWDEKLLEVLDIPREMLPEVYPSSRIFGTAIIQDVEIPIAGAAGDQQAALLGQCCFDKGDAKNTYGTGCFLLMNTGNALYESKSGLLTTIAASTNKKVQYALEGSVFVGGAVIQWIRDQMGFINESADSEYFAGKVSDTGGVYLVPAFTGLGAPYWDMYARGCIVGITRGTKREHIIRAAEESIAYQSLDIIRAMEKDTGAILNELKVDGGACRDNFLMQFQADIMGGIICRPLVRETTALGAACLAGLETGFWETKEEFRSKWHSDITFAPIMDTERQKELIDGWHKAVGRSRSWQPVLAP